MSLKRRARPTRKLVRAAKFIQEQIMEVANSAIGRESRQEAFIVQRVNCQIRHPVKLINVLSVSLDFFCQSRGHHDCELTFVTDGNPNEDQRRLSEEKAELEHEHIFELEVVTDVGSANEDTVFAIVEAASTPMFISDAVRASVVMSDSAEKNSTFLALNSSQVNINSITSAAEVVIASPEAAGDDRIISDTVEEWLYPSMQSITSGAAEILNATVDAFEFEVVTRSGSKSVLDIEELEETTESARSAKVTTGNVELVAGVSIVAGVVALLGVGAVVSIVLIKLKRKSTAKTTPEIELSTIEPTAGNNGPTSRVMPAPVTPKPDSEAEHNDPYALTLHLISSDSEIEDLDDPDPSLDTETQAEPSGPRKPIIVMTNATNISL